MAVRLADIGQEKARCREGHDEDMAQFISFSHKDLKVAFKKWGQSKYGGN